MDTVELTELEKLEVTRVDAVTRPANGFPVLLMKGVAKAPVDGGGDTEGPTHGAFDGTHTHKHVGPDGEMHSHSHSHDGDGDHGHSHAGKSLPEWHAGAAELVKAIGADGEVDEQPDIDGGNQAIALIAKLIGYEAQELAAGCVNEVYDIQLLSEAVCALKCWLGNEQAVQDGDTGPAAVDGLMQSAAGCGCCDACTCDHAAKAAESAKTQNDLPDSAFAYIEPGGTKDEEGKTTPRSKRHFPVHDAAHARNALARLSSSPFGGKAKAKVHAAAKKFGIDVSDDTSKSQIAEETVTVDTETQGTGSLAKAVEDAVTKAVAPLQKRIETLDAELAKVKAAPVPGGPVLSRNVQVKQPGGVVSEDWAAKAAYYRDMAEQVTDRTTADGYRKLAREADEKAVKQTG